MDLFDVLFDFPELVKIGTDAVAYFVMAGVGTLLFLGRLALTLFGGDVDVEGDVGIDHGADSDSAFGIFSLLSILAFFMGTGWMGLACRIDWGLGRLPSAFIASGFGAVMMLAASGLSYATRRLNREVTYDAKTAIGRTARVYLTIPAKGEGQGQVEVSVSGRRKVMNAQSNGPQLAAFADVRVVGVRDDDCLVVEPIE